mmetsp:Transcript_7586/g.14071  ORF Transcript_7586/g.14071 Transcript_7586/m.14071 type:complete len:137 (+) Transcript_7586:52-462(+)
MEALRKAYFDEDDSNVPVALLGLPRDSVVSEVLEVELQTPERQRERLSWANGVPVLLPAQETALSQPGEDGVNKRRRRLPHAVVPDLDEEQAQTQLEVSAAFLKWAHLQLDRNSEVDDAMESTDNLDVMWPLNAHG